MFDSDTSKTTSNKRIDIFSPETDIFKQEILVFIITVINFDKFENLINSYVINFALRYYSLPSLLKPM